VGGWPGSAGLPDKPEAQAVETGVGFQTAAVGYATIQWFVVPAASPVHACDAIICSQQIQVGITRILAVFVAAPFGYVARHVI